MTEETEGTLAAIAITVLMAGFMWGGYVAGKDTGARDSEAYYQRQAIDHGFGHHDQITGAYAWGPPSPEPIERPMPVKGGAR